MSRLILIAIIVSIASIKKSAAENDNLCRQIVEKAKIVNAKIVYYNETILKCCEGYFTVAYECQPVCKGCTNGVCIKPNHCACSEGYANPATTTSMCVPVCDQDCPQFSRCIEPQKCDCNPGYRQNPLSGKCEVYECDGRSRPDYRTNQCILKTCSCLSDGGYCVNNYNKCICREGFRRINATFCEALCQDKCEHSECVGPNQCECWPNYRATFDPNFCEPDDLYQPAADEDDELCQNDECLPPPPSAENVDGKLQCKAELFHPDIETKQCVLNNCSCQSGGYCLNDYSECTCYEGFHRISENLCEPVCEPVCEHAVCVGPNQCECRPDSHITANPNICEQNDVCQLQLCENGECLLTGECKCKKGFMKSLDVIKGQIICEKISVFFGKTLPISLGIFLALAFLVGLIVYMAARKGNNEDTTQYVRPSGGDDDG